MNSDNFINIPFTADNLDKYYVRKSIFQSLENNLKNFKGELLDIGCGKMPYKNFILNNSSVQKYCGLDIANALQYDLKVKPDYTWDGLTMPFPNESFNTAFGTEVLEHCKYPKIILDETYRVLREGGCFFFTVPFLWNLHETPHDEYRYTPFALERLLKDSGFKNIKIEATGGWHAAMAQMLGLWVRRSPMTVRKRNILSKILKPIIKKLIKMDSFNSITFSEGQMITGLSGIAYK